jgi:osmotically-inducible protein OsmY
MKTFKTILTSLVLAGGLACLQTAYADNSTHSASTDQNSIHSASTGQYIDDSAITAKIKAKFVGDSVIKSSQIHVATSNGVVELSGFVDNRIQKDRAEKIAETTDGVRDVRNDIEVK